MTIKELENKIKEQEKTINQLRKGVGKILEYLEDRTHSKKNKEYLWLLREFLWK